MVANRRNFRIENKVLGKMSQFWHAHWAEDGFKPGRLGNWQVPNWHPVWPCARHCDTTKFLADASGRLLPDRPRPKASPWGDFKGTWELPLKIDRKIARELSAPSQHKLAAWDTHKIRHERFCKSTMVRSTKIKKKKEPVSEERIESATKADEKTDRTLERNQSKTPIKEEKSKNPEVKGKEILATEQSIEQEDQNVHEESEEPKCPYSDSSDSHSSGEKLEKTKFYNVCPVHQDLKL